MTDPHPVDDDPRLQTLLDWRQQLIDSGAVSARSFKEAHLRLVLRSGRTEVDQVRAMLPGSAAEHAEDMARVLRELEADPGTTVPVGAGTTGRHHTTDAGAAADTGGFAATDPVPFDEPPPAAANFAPFGGGVPAAEVHPIALFRRRDVNGGRGALELRWPAYESAATPVVLYRLVSGDDGPPHSPDRADLVAVTAELSATDERMASSAVRSFQVWANAGATHAEALAAQPVLHASGMLISPLADFVVREDAGRVIGQWSVPAGVSAVYLYRVPAEDADKDGPQYRILPDGDNLNGFVDTGVDRGRRYVYRARCAAPVEGVLRLSEATAFEVEVSAVLLPVTDLGVSGGSEDGTMLELTWTNPPAGKVVIYRTEDGPSAGADATELPGGALEQVGLADEMRLTQPVAEQRDADGHVRSMMVGVSWPNEWSRAYFTPVTLIGDRARLGTTFSTVRTGLIRDIDLAEYCNKQVLTFDWPDGAAAVVVYVAPKGYDARAAMSGTSFEITLEEYERYGGMQFAGQLPLGGCSLHLAPVAFSGGRRIMGATASIDYHGLLRLQYGVRIGRGPDGQPTTATIAMRSEYDLPGSPVFVLVNNPQRIPLSIYDGQPVDVAPLDEHGQLAAQPSKELRWSQLSTSGGTELWAANLRGRQGWIRLFVNTPSPLRLRVIALLDPPVETLRLTPAAP
ncbi:hypothetical protein O6P37_15815 [Mycobacterium sp. CPCC 205372]|uniref:ESX-1 scaffolding and assembly protein SaeA n=1 Tax=Mycobacterium hippophais TaxID=3016340 RepID=A0ABT4PUU5_9MYCO|nr:hypothetical protein [Mycobacterium hippophais]MCZ8380336.1 hypothetical protein [Mycobacterium hippophais]